LVALRQNVKDRPVQVSFIAFFVVLDALVQRFCVTKTYLTYGLTLQQFLSLEETLFPEILKSIQDQVLQVGNSHAKRNLNGFIENVFDFITIKHVSFDDSSP
jgi:hypothetical protein